MAARFFKPYVGAKYQQGINGKKILVMGASFYCSYSHCPHFAQCTDIHKKDSSPWDRSCPEYSKYSKVLHNEPSYCIEDAPRTYGIFAKTVGQAFFDGKKGYEEFWEHFAFTNYVQFFLPASSGAFRETHWSDLSERDFKAFIETLQELKPDIVIIWGTIINKSLKEDNPYVENLEILTKTGGYVCHMKLPISRHRIALINPYHPSSSAWYSGFNEFKKHLAQLLNG